MSRRYLMAFTGAMPAVALTVGLLLQPEESSARQEYWPWLPIAVLIAGVAFSAFFWIFLAGRGRRDTGEKR